MTNPVRPGFYRHYKGRLYKVFGEAKHSETEEVMVVYQTWYGDRSWWVRPKAMFAENVETDGVVRPRFEFVGEEELGED